MEFNIITIFPKIFNSYFNESIIKRAQKNRKIKINIINLRGFASGRHRTVDEKPYGGGAGMVLMVEPVIKAVNSILPHLNPPLIKGRKKEGFKKTHPTGDHPKGEKIVVFSASGKQFNSKMAGEFVKKYNRIIMVAGHYEGIDERIFKVLSAIGHKPLAVSVGPYVLTGGELPAMVVVDAVARHIPGVLGKIESLEEKRYGVGVPTYTRPEVFKFKNREYKVPKVLLSGNHKKIEVWRKKHQK